MGFSTHASKGQPHTVEVGSHVGTPSALGHVGPWGAGGLGRGRHLQVPVWSARHSSPQPYFQPQGRPLLVTVQPVAWDGCRLHRSLPAAPSGTQAGGRAMVIPMPHPTAPTSLLLESPLPSISLEFPRRLQGITVPLLPQPTWRGRCP